jgi:MtaA/CmuA family methyltransferase
MTSTERLRRVLRGEAVDRLLCMPILMIWAAQDAGVSYADYVQDYRVLGDCQLRLLEQFPLDVAQLISDPYRETADTGAELQYYNDGPPRCLRPVLADKACLASLRPPDPLAGGRMTDRVRGAAYLRVRLRGDVPIMGWVEGPIAQAVDLRGMTELMLDLVDDRAFVRELFDWVVELEIAFALAQIEAGCDMIGIGDAAASLVSAAIYEELVLPGEQRIVEAIHRAGAVARLHICGNTTHLLPLMSRTGCEIIDLDHLAPIERARPAMGPEPVLLGNFDPVGGLLHETPEGVKAWCRRCHEACGDRHIIGPGCEVPPGTPHANIMAMCEYAREAAQG